MRNTVTFILNGKVEHVAGIEPTTTLLQWLRRQQRLTGTKEGCAEGDCGACTVAVGRLENGRVHHRAVNACIQMLPMLEGTSVTTVEGLANADSTLHPVQQAMVEAHASQCGFCTPGFVMSLAAMYFNAEVAPTQDAIDAALAGNLCRCTGYGPIVAAAERMFTLQRPVGEADRRAEEARLLASIAHDEIVVVESAGHRMVVPGTLDDFARTYEAHPDATVIAGATDAGLWVTKQTRALPLTIHIGRVCELAKIERSRDRDVQRITIGAGVTHAQAAAALATDLPTLGVLWRRFAGLQVRNVGTIGGNIANGSPIGDLAPALIALGATLHLRRGDVQRTLPVEGFFVAYGKQDRQPGEFVTGVSFDVTAATATDFACHKVSKRQDDDISAVCGAFNIHVANSVIASARIAFGGMAATPRRAKAVEAELIGRPWTRATIDAVLPAFDADFTPISDMRASAAYRSQVAKNLLLRVYLERSKSHANVHLGRDLSAVGG